MKAAFLLVCVIASLSLVHAHSWVQCADYTEENGRTWDPSNCRGWPRNYDNDFKAAGYGFGADVGFNYQPKETAPCKSEANAGSYTANYPKATYNAGQRVCLAWPPKNHVAAVCNNPNIGDAGTKIYRSGINPTSDPTLTQFHQNLVADLGTNKGTQGIGFQNCPDFCANADKSLCTSCFEVPDLPQGSYTFLWEWAFNGPTDLYTNCFDVEIVKDSGKTLSKVYTKVTPDEYKTIKANGTPDIPTDYSGGSSVTGGTGGSGTGGDNVVNGGDDGMTAGGKAALALFFIGLFAVVVAAVFFYRKNGHVFGITKEKIFPKKSPAPAPSRRGADYVAFSDSI